MEDDKSTSVYNLITSLCEKFANSPNDVRKLRVLSYELFLGKRTPSQKKSHEDLQSSDDPHCNLLAWQFILIHKYDLRKHAEQLKEYHEYLSECYQSQPTLFTSILRFLLDLRDIPQNDDIDHTDLSSLPCLEEPDFSNIFRLPQSIVCEAAKFCDNSFYFKSKRKMNSAINIASERDICCCPNSASRISCRSLCFSDIFKDEGYISPTKSPTENIWEIASKSRYSDRRNWESFGYPEPDKERPFLSELGEMSSLWVENLQSLYFVKMFRDGVVLRSQMRAKKDFIRDVKFLLAGLGSDSFNYNPDGDFYLLPGISLEGITPDSLAAYCKDLMYSGHCYKALSEMSVPDVCTGKYKQDGYIFGELCESISRYLLFHRTAVFSIPDSTSLLRFFEHTEQLRSQIKTLACVCKVGPFIESEQVPDGVALLNYLYQQILSVHDEKVRLVLYSVFFPCCQVYFSRFLQQWILEGVINDPYGEFLVKPNFKYIATRGRTYWTRSYALREDTVPDFLIDLRTEILNCGKAMNLLKLCVPSNKLCLYLRNRRPLIVTCCLTTEQLTTLEKNATSYYLEASAECGPKVSLARIVARTREEDASIMSVIAKKRATTLKRLELERQKLNEEKMEKKLEEMAMLREQYNSAMIQKQVKVFSEIEKELKALEEDFTLEEMRERLIKEEANKLINHYNQLCEISEKRKEAIEKHIQNIKNLTLDHPPSQYEQLSLHVSSEIKKLPENLNMQDCVEKSKSDEKIHVNPRSPSVPNIEVEVHGDGIEEEPVDNDLKSSNSLDILNANTVKSPEYSVGDNLKTADSEDSPMAPIIGDDLKKTGIIDDFSSLSLDSNIRAALENFETARRNKHKVLTQEMGIDFHPLPPKVQTKSLGTTALTEAQINKIKVLGTEFGITVVKDDTMALDREITPLEINRNRILSSNKCFYGTIVEKVDNVNFVNKNVNEAIRQFEDSNKQENKKNQLKKSTSLQLNLNQNHLGKTSKSNEVDRPIPMSVDSTPLSDFPQSQSTVTTPASSMFQSIEKGQLENCPTTAGTHVTDEGFDFKEVLENKSYTTYNPPKSNTSTSKPVFSKRVSPEDASGVVGNCLKLFLHESVSIPVTTQLKLANNELLRYFIEDLGYLKHLSSLRDYFFLNDGEFGRNVTENLFEKLYEANSTSELINVRTLQCLVFNAVDISSKHQVNYNCLSFKINNMPKCFDLGDPDVLDCLSMTYKVSWPLNILLPVDTFSKYDDIFKYLLKLNRMSWVLKKIVLELKILARQTGKKEIYLMASPHYRRVHQCRHVMMHFIQTLQNYIVGEVLQMNWEIFNKNLEEVTNLDDLYSAHTAYIKNILFMCLLNQKTLQIRKVIHRIFVVILKFYDYLRSRCWTCENGSYEHPNFNKLESIFNNFEELVLYLFKVGHKVARSGYQPHLIQLLDMLDINGYYSRRISTC